MKKTFIYSISLLFLLAVGNSCKKEKMTFNPDLCGTWELRDMATSEKYTTVQTISFYQFNKCNYDTINYGILNLTITSSGKFYFSNKRGKEKFQLIKFDSYKLIVSKNTINNIEDVAYNLYLRNWKGEIFQFKLSYDQEDNTLVTVPWS